MEEQPKPQYQVFVTVKEIGELSSCEIGVPIVRREPADFFFLIEDEALITDLKENAQNYKVVLNGMKPELVPIEPPIEATPVEEETPTEEVTTPEN
ncbi:hypothetical protein [Priestia megaterium]|uniref:hypothetical protein n=1 Tax=Priestia megaterium TaxID=1404 RepID=UPI003672AC36